MQDLQNISDLSDLHLVFPYDAWLRGACKDAMAVKIGQKLLVKCLKLFLIEHKVIKSDDGRNIMDSLIEMLGKNAANNKQKVE